MLQLRLSSFILLFLFALAAVKVDSFNCLCLFFSLSLLVYSPAPLASNKLKQKPKRLYKARLLL